MAKKILVNILILINNLIQKYDLRVDILVSIDIKWWNNVHCEVFLNNSLPVEVFYYNREIEEINPLELTSVVDLDYEGVKTVLFHIPSILTIIFNEITDKNEFFNLFSGIPLLKCNNYSICLDKLISKANKL